MRLYKATSNGVTLFRYAKSFKHAMLLFRREFLQIHGKYEIKELKLVHPVREAMNGHA